MADGRKTYAEQLVQERTGRDVEDLLRELYVDQGWTDIEIAGSLKVSRMAIAAWRTKYGISRADRRREVPRVARVVEPA